MADSTAGKLWYRKKTMQNNTKTTCEKQNSSYQVTHQAILWEELQALMEKGQYPFHMPGHKRNLSPVPDLPVAWDVTEIAGSDDLHDAQGILREAMERTATLCGADRTWYLVGGSTCGNLAAVRAAAPRGSEVIVARNCHKSIYHAIELGNLRVHWITPPMDEAFGIYGSVPAAKVKELLDKYPAVKAVILTSPTYEGVLSDSREIAKCCHDRPSPAALVVDEAHGAHLGLPFGGDTFGEGAVACGADLVIQSTHKTLPSLTQTALLHVGKGRLDRIVEAAEVERQLDVFETSSPSYPLMASLDGCTGLLQARGKELFDAWQAILKEFDRCTTDLKKWKILCHGADSVDNHPLFYRFDPSKIFFARKDEPGIAARMEDLLQKDFHMELEMRCGENLLAMTSCADSPDALMKLSEALHALENLPVNVVRQDKRQAKIQEESQGDASQDDAEKNMQVRSALKEYEDKYARGETKDVFVERQKEVHDNKEHGKSMLPSVGDIHYTSAEAVERARTDSRRIPIRQAIGRVSGEYLWAYPPGVPIAAPGEEITEQLADYVESCLHTGTALKHSGQSPRKGEETYILVLGETSK